ncbi:xanthine dehydrogenase family protein molybdopterin-binding subunit [Bradyrhizobium sp. NP1]|uniref:xanthine dehydrogenase family protein molybdopterin-binding subunit n=1 Tax=Bradyrhizobium sp. NP1 TaxID=3049772 RepID=UPI0025A68CA9|nr:xanthine dehydrogenase family protein molybdopterin-binding subunit [Bradyrhizobium sp. NP1]WJR76763.1 xanthine dehydrogenase family protein molybdopterin-binding subunit [Bradyrhizobium sp. NP1]
MTWVGKQVSRREDGRFITGRGGYTDDLKRAGMTYAAFVRSPFAHARILSIEIDEAARMPGVLAVLTGAMWAAEGRGEMPTIAPVRFPDGSPMNEASRPVFATDIVRHVGDTVAIVVAETKWQALDALDKVQVDYEPLPAVVEAADALAEGAPLVHPQFGTNVTLINTVGDEAAVKAAFARADYIGELEVVANRITANAMEPRTYLGEYDKSRDHYTLTASTQIPHLVKNWLADDSLRVPEHQIRVVAPDVGGGFGPKNTHYGEEAAVLWAAQKVGRPVKFIATRSESLITDAHGRDHVTRCRIAMNKQGDILGVEARTIANLGAYMTAFGPSIPAHYYPRVLAGLYRTKAIFCHITGVYTHTVPVEAYRGAGRPEGIYVLERLLENAARDLGIDVCEIRRRNFIKPSDCPYETTIGVTYDSCNPDGLLDKVTSLAGYDDLRREQAQLRSQGIRMGIGLAGFVDCAGAPSRIAAKIGRRIGGYDVATVRVHPSGKVTLLCGTHSHGQGHETSFCQIAADTLGVPYENIELVEGDTDRIANGLGTWGSRSLFLMGPAIARASGRIINKCKRQFAHLMECSTEDVVYQDGTFELAGTDRKMTFTEVARWCYRGHSYPEDMEMGLEETVFYDPPARNTPSGMQLAVVIVDEHTGLVRVRDFAAIDDCGKVVNPQIVEGQLHGGAAQGIGQALMEQCTYDRDSGQLIAGSFMDYAMPRADDLPSFRFESQETLSPNNPLGVKGAGESGSIAAPAAVVNAVVDALWDLGVREINMPLTPRRVWHAIRDAREQKSPCGARLPSGKWESDFRNLAATSS